jgi:GntR family transcriptional regulator
MLHVDPRSPTPLYAQLDRAIRAAIASGELERGDQLPTVRQLAVDLRVNANTVAKVYAELERAGVLATQRGIGTFVVGGDPGSITTAARDRERELRQLVDRLLAESAALGISANDVLRAIQARFKENR